MDKLQDIFYRYKTAQRDVDAHNYWLSIYPDSKMIKLLYNQAKQRRLRLKKALRMYNLEKTGH